MSKIKMPPSTLLAPVPAVMVSCGNKEEGTDIVTIAWTGIINSHPAKTYISVRPERFSYGIIKKNGEFAINLVSAELARAADLCGMKTGAKVDKFKEAKLTPEYVEDAACPIIAESPISLICKVTDVIPLGSHDMFIAEIKSIYVNDGLMEEGKLCINRAHLAAYAHGEYYTLGKRIGKFGFSVKKKTPPKKK
ncbi:MAG: flavin reductase family protein [Clostridia bacterium]|nr:flavin reductase family protein [Clostridia bacterium]MBQ8862623.1 flavin reductase family protein [Clostridia bacterium]